MVLIIWRYNPGMKLNNKQIKFLKAKAHALKPVITIGNKGISDNLISELDESLGAHELLKIKLPGVEKSDRSSLLTEVCKMTQAHEIGLIGRIGIVFRPRKDSKFDLPD